VTDLERRKLLRNLARGISRAADRAHAELYPPQRRPPGALREAEFLSACTRCGKCSQACPEKAIFVFTESAERLAATPVMLPDERACALCDGWPCASACEDGALRVPADDAPHDAYGLGVVRIASERCLAYLGPECGACVGLCPRQLQGMRLRAWKPEVVPEQCVGCGVCIEACPTDPPAIELVALSTKPS
jgi:ferredoxin